MKSREIDDREELEPERFKEDQAVHEWYGDVATFI